MEQIYFNFNEKDIPYPTNDIFITMLVSTILTVMTRVRWKLAMYKNPNWTNGKETFGFRTNKSPPKDDDLDTFENLMLDIPNRIRFINPNNVYQKKLKDDIQLIRRQNKVIVKSDKNQELLFSRARGLQETHV